MTQQVTFENLFRQNTHTIYEFVMKLDGGLERLPELLQFGAITKEQYDLVRREAGILGNTQS